MKLPDIEIIVGTYNEFLLGYQLKRDDTLCIDVKQTFADKAHAGSVRCLAVSGKWIATGGVDDRIFIYDMERRRQAHIINNHTGSVNSLDFTSDMKHLLSGGDDGQMIATRVGSWTMVNDWQKSHNRKPINMIASHPSSRLALSLVGDQVLNTWNLTKKRIVYRTNLKNKQEIGSAPSCLTWSPTGNHFSISGPLVTDIFDIRTASVVRRFKMPSKPVCVAWLNQSICLTGLENGSIAWSSLEDEDNAEPLIIPAHDSRVKVMAAMYPTLVTISSSGELKVWTCEAEDKDLDLLAETNIDCRPTCLGLLHLNQFGKKMQDERNKELPSSPKEANQKDTKTVKSAPIRSFVTIEYDQGEGDKKSEQKEQEGNDSNLDSNDSDDSLDEPEQDNSDTEEDEEEENSEEESEEESDVDERKPKPKRSNKSNQKTVPAIRKRPAAAPPKKVSKLKKPKHINK